MAFAPYIGAAASLFGNLIMWATELHPFIMGIIVSVVVGVVLTLPISSAAICAALGLKGLGTSMLQMGNIVKNPRIWIPPTLAAAITGPIATCIFDLRMDGEAIASGMGTCGLVGQIGVYSGWLNQITEGTRSGITAFDWVGLILVCFVLPAVLSEAFCLVLRKIEWIKENDLKLENM